MEVSQRSQASAPIGSQSSSLELVSDTCSRMAIRLRQYILGSFFRTSRVSFDTNLEESQLRWVSQIVSYARYVPWIHYSLIDKFIHPPVTHNKPSLGASVLAP